MDDDRDRIDVEANDTGFGFGPPAPRTPAGSLEGLDLPGGWTVTRRLTDKKDRRRSIFSECYLAKHRDGRVAFLKAFDYTASLTSHDTATTINALTEDFNFERNLLKMCRDARMDHVVRAIADGEVMVPNFNEAGKVSYLLLEVAQHDVRDHLDQQDVTDDFKMRCLHGAAVGMKQLHARSVAHQDTKPSNLLVFVVLGEILIKLGDLGSASRRGIEWRNDEHHVGGDPAYAPFELLYGEIAPAWRDRRLGCDLFHLGNLIAVLFAGITTTAAVAAELPPGMHWNNWRGDYLDVLDDVRDAFDIVAARVEQSLPEPIRHDLIVIYRQLCDPDPFERGHPLNRRPGFDEFGLERYVTRFDLLRRRLAVAR